MDTMHELAEAIDDLRERANGVAVRLSEAFGVLAEADEHDTDSLHLYEAEQLVSGLAETLRQAREHIATLVGLRRLSQPVE